MDAVAGEGQARQAKLEKGKAVMEEEEEEEEEAKEVPGNTEEEFPCGICLAEEVPDRGELECCNHLYCFPCIMEWSKVESRCPMCKRRFTRIKRPGVKKGPKSFRVPMRDQKHIMSEDDIAAIIEPYSTSVCTQCHDSGNEELLLLCDRCDSAAHTYCIGLGNTVPQGDYYCDSCRDQVEPELMAEIFGDDSEDRDWASEDDSSPSETDAEEEKADVAGAGIDTESGRETLSRVLDQALRRSARGSRRAREDEGSSRGRTAARGGRRRQTSRRSSSAPRNSRRRRGRGGASRGAVRGVASESDGLAGAMRRSREEVEPQLVWVPTPGLSARTVTQQRRLQHRVQVLRQNWERLRRGEIAFDIRPSVPTTASQRQTWRSSANGNTPGERRDAPLVDPQPQSSPCPTLIPREDLERAWSMLDRARATSMTEASTSTSATPPLSGRQVASAPGAGATSASQAIVRISPSARGLLAISPPPPRPPAVTARRPAASLAGPARCQLPAARADLSRRSPPGSLVPCGNVRLVDSGAPLHKSPAARPSTGTDVGLSLADVVSTRATWAPGGASSCSGPRAARASPEGGRNFSTSPEPGGSGRRMGEGRPCSNSPRNGVKGGARVSPLGSSGLRIPEAPVDEFVNDEDFLAALYGGQPKRRRSSERGYVEENRREGEGSADVAAQGEGRGAGELEAKHSDDVARPAGRRLGDEGGSRSRSWSESQGPRGDALNEARAMGGKRKEEMILSGGLRNGVELRVKREGDEVSGSSAFPMRDGFRCNRAGGNAEGSSRSVSAVVCDGFERGQGIKQCGERLGGGSGGEEGAGLASGDVVRKKARVAPPGERGACPERLYSYGGRGGGTLGSLKEERVVPGGSAVGDGDRRRLGEFGGGTVARKKPSLDSKGTKETLRKIVKGALHALYDVNLISRDEFKDAAQKCTEQLDARAHKQTGQSSAALFFAEEFQGRIPQCAYHGPKLGAVDVVDNWCVPCIHDHVNAHVAPLLNGRR